MTESFAVFDIDGVLADVTHRLHHLQGRRKNWAAFFAAAGHDPLLPEGRARAVAAAQAHALVYLSGRPERLRRVTQSWLDRHDLPSGAVLLRPNRDHRPARLLKPELLERVRSAGPVALVVDDDAEVCAVLAERGYPVVHARWAPDSRSLRSAQEEQGRT
jgi:phosphoglycolate phosphatase-like HAD superfamily hydrolase